MKKICQAAAEDAAMIAALFMQTRRADVMRGPAQIARAAVELCSIAAKLQTIHVDDCNYPDDNGRRERARKRLVENAALIVRAETAGSGYGIRIQSDPRGFPLYLVNKEGSDVFGLSGRYGNRY